MNLDEKVSMKQFEQTWHRMIAKKENQMDEILYGQMIRDYFTNYMESSFTLTDFLTIVLVGIDRYHQLVLSELDHCREQHKYFLSKIRKIDRSLTLLLNIPGLQYFEKRIKQLNINLIYIHELKKEKEEEKKRNGE